MKDKSYLKNLFENKNIKEIEIGISEFIKENENYLEIFKTPFLLEKLMDNNNSLKEICGKPVIGIEELKSIYKNYSVVLAVSKLQYMNDIATQLTKSNIPYRLFVEEEEAALSKSKK